MEVDVTVIVKDYAADIVPLLAAFDTREVDGYLDIRANFTGADQSVESGVIGFIESLDDIDSKLWSSQCTLELAYYYDADTHASFSASISNRLVATLSQRNMGMKVIGYPCVEEQNG